MREHNSAENHRNFTPVVFFLFLMAIPQLVSTKSLYAIGNSLTNDTYPDAMVALAQDAGLSLTTGYHIRSSASMTYMVAVPTDFTLVNPSRHDVALIVHSYDAIALQPYFGFDSATYASERAALITVIERVLQSYPGKTVFYIYAPWPSINDISGNLDAYWHQVTGFDSSGMWKNTRVYFDELLTELRTYFGARASIRVIPVGDVMARIDRDSKAGLLPGIGDISMLYRDTLHMGEVGRFVAASTVIATLFQQQPSSSASQLQYQFNDGAAMLTPQLAKQLESLIWSVVSADERTRAASSSSSSSSGGSSSVSSSSLSSSASGASASSGEASSNSANSTVAPTSNSGSGALDAVLLLVLLAVESLKRTAKPLSKWLNRYRSTQLGGWSRWPRTHS